MNTRIALDIGNKCTHCLCDTSVGSGNYVNRIPIGHEWTVHTPNGEQYLICVDGYMCAGCQCIECDECGESTLEYTTDYNGIWLCPECTRDHTQCDEQCDSPEHY